MNNHTCYDHSQSINKLFVKTHDTRRHIYFDSCHIYKIALLTKCVSAGDLVLLETVERVRTQLFKNCLDSYKSWRRYGLEHHLANYPTLQKHCFVINANLSFYRTVALACC